MGALGAFVDVGVTGLAAFIVGFVAAFLAAFLACFGAFLAADFDASFLAAIFVGFLVGLLVGFLAALGRLAPPLARLFDDAWAGLRDFVALAMGVHANVCEASLSNGTDA
jgi:hypothetical protein